MALPDLAGIPGSRVGDVFEGAFFCEPVSAPRMTHHLRSEEEEADCVELSEGHCLRQEKEPTRERLAEEPPWPLPAGTRPSRQQPEHPSPKLRI